MKNKKNEKLVKSTDKLKAELDKLDNQRLQICNSASFIFKGNPAQNKDFDLQIKRILGI